MSASAVLGLSLALQLVAALLALRLIRVTGRPRAWVLIAAAISLMAARRVVTIFRILSGDAARPPDLGAELVALAVSVLMVLGLASIGPLFHAIRRSEAALAESEHRYRSVITALAEGIVVRDVEGMIRACNPSAERILGLPAGQMIGRSSVDPPGHSLGEDGSRFPSESEPALVTLRTGRACSEIVTGLPKPDGALTWISVNTEPLLRPGEAKPFGVVSSITDITERKRTEQVLREIAQGVSPQIGEAFFRSLVEHLAWALGVSHVFIGALVEGGEERVRTIAVCSDGAIRDNFEYELRDTPCQNVVGKTLCVYANGVRALFPRDQLLKEMGVESYCGTPLFDSSGRSLGLLVVMDRQELAEPKLAQALVQIFGVRAAAELERKRAEEAVKRAEEKYRGIVENALEGIFQSTREGRLLTANPALARILGYDSVEDLLANTEDLAQQYYVEPEQRHALLRLLEAQGEVRGFEYRLRRRDGSTIWVSENARVARGALSCYEGSLVDITERKQADQAQAELQATIRKAATEWQTTFDAIEAPVLIAGLDGKVQRLNRAAKDLARGEYRTSIGRPVASLAAGQPWAGAAEMVRTVSRTRAGTACLVEDGTAGRTWDVSASFSGGGDDGRLILVIRDITATIKLQESLRRSETMSAMGSLVAGVAHQVRNPLFGISSTVDAFEARFGRDEAFSKYTSVLRRELERLSSLMQELLDYGRPSSPELIPGPITDAISHAIQSCLGLARRSKVRIVSAVTEPATIAMDRRRLQQVFQNLIENALQHSQPGDRVTVRGGRIEEGGRCWFECAIEDSGPGFPPKDLPRVFDPFFTRRRGGTGLGLPIAQRIVEEHGGCISAGNRRKGGAVMTVRLPLSEGP